MSANFKKPKPLPRPTEPEIISLTEDEQAFLDTTVAKINQAKMAVAQAQAEMEGGLNLIIVQRKLKGSWSLSDDNTYLLKTEPEKK